MPVKIPFQPTQRGLRNRGALKGVLQDLLEAVLAQDIMAGPAMVIVRELAGYSDKHIA